MLGEVLEQNGCRAGVMQVSGRLHGFTVLDTRQIGRVSMPIAGTALFEAPFHLLPSGLAQAGGLLGSGVRHVAQQTTLAPGTGILLIHFTPGPGQRTQLQGTATKCRTPGQQTLVAVGVELHLPRQRTGQAKAQPETATHQQPRQLNTLLRHPDGQLQNPPGIVLQPFLQAIIPRVATITAHFQPGIDRVDQEVTAHAQPLSKVAKLVPQYADKLLHAHPGNQWHTDGQHFAAREESAPAILEMHAGIYFIGQLHRHRRAQANRLTQLVDHQLQTRFAGQIQLQRFITTLAG